MDTAQVLAFSLVMLNTDAHNDAIRKDRKMTLQQYKNNLRGICKVRARANPNPNSNPSPNQVILLSEGRLLQSGPPALLLREAPDAARLNFSAMVEDAGLAREAFVPSRQLQAAL